MLALVSANRSLAAAILLVGFIAVRAEAAPETSLRLSSEPGDYIGNGINFTYTTSHGSFAAVRNARNGVTVTFTPISGQVWRMEFARPNNQALVPGVWFDAQLFSSGDPAAPGLNVTGLGRSCSQVDGSFQVKQVTYNSTGGVTAFWAVFAQRCNGAGAALCGDIRWRAELPVSITAPPTLSVVRGSEAYFDVTARSTVVTTLFLSSGDLPAGADFSDNGDRTGSLYWMTTPEQVGRHRVTFYAQNSSGVRDSAVTEIYVTGVSGLRTASEPGDPVGEGSPAEYTGETASVTALEEDGTVTVNVTSADLAEAWTLRFSGPDGADLAPGMYTNAGAWPSPGAGRAGLSVSVNGRSCDPVSGEFRVRELVRDAGGLVSFRATFEQRCADGGPALRGDVRYNAAVPIDITAPFGVIVDPGQQVLFYIIGMDPWMSPIALAAEGVPTGAHFTDFGDNSGYFTWVPANGQSGHYAVTFQATDLSGLVEDFTTKIRVTGDPLPPPPDPPVAVAGGPYSAESGSPVLFDGSGSSAPEGDPLEATWDFGDGGGATGLTTSHTYAAPGDYVVVLTVCQSGLCDSDTVAAEITSPPPPPPPAAEATSRMAPGDNPIRLWGNKPTVSVLIEPVNGSWNVAELDPASLRLHSNGTGPSDVVSGALGRTGDRDENGVVEMEVTITNEDVLRLVGWVEGRRELTLRLTASLAGGAVLETTVNVEVQSRGGKSNKLSAVTTVSGIAFSLPAPAYVQVHLFDAMGRQVAPLLESDLPSGEHVVPLPRDASGRALSAGVYFYRIIASGEVAGGRVVVTR